MTNLMRSARLSWSVLLSLAASLLVVTASPASATHDVTPARASGADRFETAAEIAQLQFPEGTTTAVVATGETFPDALAGASLSGAADAPILLVTHDTIPDITSQTLADLGVTDVHLLGGTSAISQDVEDELEESYDVGRLAGESRYDTAAAIAAEVDRLEGELGRIAGLTTAFVASGEDFPDALTAGSLATTRDDSFPILLVGGDHYPAATEQAIKDLGIDQAIIIGGHLAVSDHVERHLEEDTRSVLRLSGTDRFGTAVAVADFAMVEFDYHGVLSVLARGNDFPDALAAGLHAGRNDAPILLTDPDELPRQTHQWLHDLCPSVDAVRAVGGTAAVSEATLADAVRHAEHCHAAEDQTGETYVVEPTMPVDATSGETVQMTVRDRYDERPLQEPLDVTLFPCANVDRANGTYVDADGDGFADGIGTSDQDAAFIQQATEADSVEPGYADNARFLHGALSWQLHSDAPDCTVTVVFDDLDGDDQLPVDSEGHPLEHYGARQVTWSDSS